MAGEGVIFPDLGLHLGVMNALLDAGLLSDEELLNVLRPLTDGLDGDLEYDYTLDAENELLNAALALMHAVALDRGDVATITNLDFDGGNDIYMLIETALRVDSGGESDYYLVHSLDGIEALSNLERFDNDSYGNDIDTSELELPGQHRPL
jgi:hypothetical protein